MSEEDGDSKGFKALAERHLLPLALLASYLTVILNAVEGLTRFSSLLHEHLFVTSTVAYAAVLILSWCLRRRLEGRSILIRKIVPATALAMVTLAYIAGNFWEYWEVHWRRTGPARLFNPPKPRSEMLRQISNQGGVLLLESFELDPDLSNYIETEDTSAFGPPNQKYRTFDPDFAATSAYKEGHCTGPEGDRPIDNVLPLFKKRLRERGESSLEHYIERPEDLSHLMRDRGDIFDRIMFSWQELDELRKSAPGDFATVRDWLINCVGIQQPVFTLVIRNNARAVTLTKVVYNVLAVGQVLGGATGLIYPEKTYDHTLVHKIGRQTWPLEPPLQIAAGDVASFNLRLFAKEKDLGLGWLLKIEIFTGGGDSVSTETIQIYMNMNK